MVSQNENNVDITQRHLKKFSAILITLQKWCKKFIDDISLTWTFFAKCHYPLYQEIQVQKKSRTCECCLRVWCQLKVLRSCLFVSFSLSPAQKRIGYAMLLLVAAHGHTRRFGTTSNSTRFMKPYYDTIPQCSASAVHLAIIDIASFEGQVNFHFSFTHDGLRLYFFKILQNGAITCVWGPPHSMAYTSPWGVVF